MPYVRVKVLDEKVWECIDQLLAHPRAQLEGLRRVQQQQMEQFADALAHMKAAEQTLQECERLLSVYSDQEAEGLISRAMLRKKKAELDERANRAQTVYDEYSALIETKVLSDEEIAHTTMWLSALAEQIAAGDPLEFEDRRAIVEALNITGKMKLERVGESEEQVVYLSIYTEHLARVVLQRFRQGNHDVPLPAREESITCRTDKLFPRGFPVLTFRIVMQRKALLAS